MVAKCESLVIMNNKTMRHVNAEARALIVLAQLQPSTFILSDKSKTKKWHTKKIKRKL